MGDCTSAEPGSHLIMLPKRLRSTKNSFCVCVSLHCNWLSCGVVLAWRVKEQENYRFPYCNGRGTLVEDMKPRPKIELLHYEDVNFSIWAVLKRSWFFIFFFNWGQIYVPVCFLLSFHSQINYWRFLNSPDWWSCVLWVIQYFLLYSEELSDHGNKRCVICMVDGI